MTFDDGPELELTGRVLNKLDQYQVVATFFLVGSKVTKETEPVLKKMIAMGCEVGNHSWDYQSLVTLQVDEIKSKYVKTQDVITHLLGVEPKFFRPPNLETNQIMFDVIPLPFIGGIVCYDWIGCGTSAQERALTVLSEIEDGAIILLHDVQPEPHPSAETLDILIPNLKMQGYEFVTISDLFARNGIDPTSNKGCLWKIVR